MPTFACEQKRLQLILRSLSSHLQRTYRSLRALTGIAGARFIVTTIVTVSPAIGDAHKQIECLLDEPRVERSKPRPYSAEINLCGEVTNETSPLFIASHRALVVN